MPLILAFSIHFVLFIPFGIKIGYVLYFLGLSFSILSWYKFGLGDYSKYNSSGPFRVGYIQFTTKEYQN